MRSHEKLPVVGCLWRRIILWIDHLGLLRLKRKGFQPHKPLAQVLQLFVVS
jgi:hypothetical protein